MIVPVSMQFSVLVLEPVLVLAFMFMLVLVIASMLVCVSVLVPVLAFGANVFKLIVDSCGVSASGHSAVRGAR